MLPLPEKRRSWGSREPGNQVPSLGRESEQAPETGQPREGPNLEPAGSRPSESSGGGLFGFYQSAAGFISPEETAVREAGESGPRHASYHRRIVLVAALFGIVGAAVGITFGLLAGSETKSGREVRGVLLAPFMLGAAGILLGVAVACLFAPREFLTGPVGQKWMKLIGTNSVTVARIVCLIFGLVVMAPFVGLGLFWILAGK